MGQIVRNLKTLTKSCGAFHTDFAFPYDAQSVDEDDGLGYLIRLSDYQVAVVAFYIRLCLLKTKSWAWTGELVCQIYSSRPFHGALHRVNHGPQDGSCVIFGHHLN